MENRLLLLVLPPGFRLVHTLNLHRETHHMDCGRVATRTGAVCLVDCVGSIDHHCLAWRLPNACWCRYVPNVLLLYCLCLTYCAGVAVSMCVPGAHHHSIKYAEKWDCVSHQDGELAVLGCLLVLLYCNFMVPEQWLDPSAAWRCFQT